MADLVKTTEEERRELREKVVLVMENEGDPVGDWQKVLDVIDDLKHAEAALIIAEELTRDEVHEPNSYIPTCFWCGTRRGAPNDPGHFEHRPNCAWAKFRSIVATLQTLGCERRASPIESGSTPGQITDSCGAEGPKSAVLSASPNGLEPAPSDAGLTNQVAGNQLDANVKPARGENGAGVCRQCGGTGDVLGVPMDPNCPTCHGSGKEPLVTADDWAALLPDDVHVDEHKADACVVCDGTGRRLDERQRYTYNCSTCHGSGKGPAR